MKVDYTHNPIKVNVFSKENKVVKRLIFVGVVDATLEKQLKIVEQAQRVTSPQIKLFAKYYGKQWVQRLGLESIVGKVGGAAPNGDDGPNKANGVNGSKNNPDDADGNALDADGDEIVLDDLIGVDGDGNALDADGDEIAPDADGDEITLDEINKADGDENAPDADGDEITLDEIDSLSKLIDQPQNVTVTKPIQETQGLIKFVLNGVNVYPHDTTMQFKRKLSLATKIPIYRQNVWYIANNKPYNLNYHIKLNTKIVEVTMGDVLNKNKSIEYINDVPVLIDFYNVKNLISITNMDDFATLEQLSRKFDVYEYNMIDMSEFIGERIFGSKNSNEIEMMYYGFVVLFWPLLSPSAWRDYIKDNKSFEKIYPEIALNFSTEVAKFKLETAITEESIDLFKNPKKSTLLKGIEKNIFLGISHSVMKVSVSSDNIDLINMRNLFDKINLNEVGNYVAAKAVVLLGGKKVTLNKVFKNEQAIRRNIPLNSIVIKILVTDDAVEYIYLFIFKNGNYSIEYKSREENLYNFADVFKIVSQIVNRFIGVVNSMRSLVMAHGMRIKPMTTSNTVFTNMHVSMIYRQTVKYADFKIIERILETYSDCRIIETRDVGESESTHNFKKGVYNLNRDKLGFIDDNNNEYSYLTMLDAKIKWDKLFRNARGMFVSYKHGNVKIYVENIKEDEFSIFYMYMIHMFAKMTSDKSLGRKEDAVYVDKSAKGVKSLKQQDPILYDFKKLYNSPIVYSKICQKPYQPKIIDEDAVKSLPKDERDRVVKYWNFTTNKDAYYHCPNKRYPYINFMVKRHPKDYCIPCCKIKPSADLGGENIKSLIHDTCLKEHKYEKDKGNIITGTRYIMTYGKFITPGRICNLPETTIEPLMYESFSENHRGLDDECHNENRYFLVGIEQKIDDIKNVGYIVALSEALRMPVVEIVEKSVQMINKSPHEFKFMLNGHIYTHFKNYKNLVDGLIGAFVSKRTNEIIMSPHIPWNEIFMDIAFYYWNINTVLFNNIGTVNNESFKIVLSGKVNDCNQLKNKNYKTLFVLKNKRIYNPIFYLNRITYFKTKLIDVTLFDHESVAVDIICKVVTFNKTCDGRSLNKNMALNLDLLKEFLDDINWKKKYEFGTYFINKNNNCYYVGIKAKESIYVPINYSTYAVHKDSPIELVTEPFRASKYKQTLRALNQFIKDFNAWLIKAYNVNEANYADFEFIRLDKWLLVDNPYSGGKVQVVGFSSNGLNFYHGPIAYEDAKKLDNKPFQRLLYHPDEFNAQAHDSAKIRADHRVTNLARNIYEYSLYELIILEFSKMFSQEKNQTMRLKIKKIIIANLARNYNVMMNELISLVKQYYDRPVEDDGSIIRAITAEEVHADEDINKIITEFNNIIISNDKFDKVTIFESIDNMRFNFDNNAINKLMTMQHGDIVKELKKISKQMFHVTTGAGVKKHFETGSFPNVLVSCKDADSIYCKNKKLIVSGDDLDQYLNILAQDIANPIKNKHIFSNILTSNVLHYFKFEAHPDEHITITTQ